MHLVYCGSRLGVWSWWPPALPFVSNEKIWGLCTDKSFKYMSVSISQWLYLHHRWSSLIGSLTPSQRWLTGLLRNESILFCLLTAGCPKLKSWSGLSIPAILSLFILLISFLYQSNTGLLFNLHNGASEACGGPPLNPETLSYPLPFAIHLHPESPMRLGESKKNFFALLLYHVCGGVHFNAILFLLTWTRTKDGSLGLSTSLACNSWTSWFQHRGESWVGGGEDSVLTDVQYTQLMPQAGKSNNIICTGGSHIYYPICPSGGGWKYCNSSQHRNAHVKNFIMDIVRQLLAMPGIQIEKWGKMPHN